MFNQRKPACFILWFTGLSGSGKSSLSVLLKRELNKKKKTKIKIIDGDLFRKKYPKFGYSINDREKIGYLKAKVALNYYNKGYITLVSGIAHDKIWRKKIKQFFRNVNYSEIYLKCPLKKCISRKKKLYSKNSQNIVGISGAKYKYQESKNYDLRINTATNNRLKCLSILKKYLKQKYGK